MDATVIALWVSLMGNVTQAAVAIINQRRSPAQKESEIIKNYGELIKEYRTKIVELSDEIERVTKERDDDAAAHDIETANYEAIIQKRRIEYEQELSHLRNELQAYQIGWAKLRRFAVKYAPKDVTLPEIDGVTTVDIK